MAPVYFQGVSPGVRAYRRAYRRVRQRRGISGRCQISEPGVDESGKNSTIRHLICNECGGVACLVGAGKVFRRVEAFSAGISDAGKVFRRVAAFSAGISDAGKVFRRVAAFSAGRCFVG